jgi:hypothetical protein
MPAAQVGRPSEGFDPERCCARRTINGFGSGLAQSSSTAAGTTARVLARGPAALGGLEAARLGRARRTVVGSPARAAAPGQRAPRQQHAPCACATATYDRWRPNRAVPAATPLQTARNIATWKLMAASMSR